MDVANATDFELLALLDGAPGPTELYELAMTEAIHRATMNAIVYPEFASAFGTSYLGPVCEARQQYGQCLHGSCDTVWDEIPAIDFCHEHGWQIITESGGNSGFAGGGIYWDVMLCGHVHMDESGDVRAAI